MKAETLKKAILQYAMQGKLVEQDPNDEPASVLLERIKAEKEQLIKDGKIKKEKPLSPITEDEIPYELPQGWEWIRLGNITNITGGKRVPAGYQLLTQATPYVYIRVTDMINYSIKNFDLRYISQDIREKISRYIIKKDDLYLTIAGTIGRVGIIPENMDNMNLTENAVRIIPYLVYNRFLMYLIDSIVVQNQFIEKTNQLGQPKLALERIKTTYVPLPPLAEQQRIVDKLEQILPLVEEYGKNEEKLSKLNETLPDKIKQSILRHAVQGKLVPQNPTDEPASVLLERIKAEKEQLIKDGKIKKEKSLPPITEDEIPFEIPASWQWCRLGSILTKLTDGTHKTPTYTNEGIPFLSVKDMSSGKLNFSNTKFVSREEHDILYKRCNPEKGDLLVTKVGTTGVPVIVDIDKEFSLFVSVALLKFNNELINIKYLYYMILSPLVSEQAKTNTKGVCNQNWVIDKIAQTLITIPPLAEQHRIVTKVEELLSTVDSLKV